MGTGLTHALVLRLAHAKGETALAVAVEMIINGKTIQEELERSTHSDFPLSRRETQAYMRKFISFFEDSYAGGHQRWNNSPGAPGSKLAIPLCQEWDTMTLHLLCVGENKIWSESG